MKKLYIILAHILAFIDDKASDLASAAWAKKNTTKEKLHHTIVAERDACLDAHSAIAKAADEEIARTEASIKAKRDAALARVLAKRNSLSRDLGKINTI